MMIYIGVILLTLISCEQKNRVFDQKSENMQSVMDLSVEPTAPSMEINGHSTQLAVGKPDSVTRKADFLLHQYQTLDTDHNEQISPAEFSNPSQKHQRQWARLKPEGRKAKLESLQSKRKQAFLTMDIDKNGMLSKSEFITGMKIRRENQKKRAILGKIEKLDANKDGKIELGEIVKGQAGLADSMNRVVAELDKNKDGILSPQELGHMEQILSETKSDNPQRQKKQWKRWRRFLKQDLNRDGTITPTETQTILAKKREQFAREVRELDSDNNNEISQKELDNFRATLQK